MREPNSESFRSVPSKELLLQITIHSLGHLRPQNRGKCSARARNVLNGCERVGAMLMNENVNKQKVVFCEIVDAKVIAI